MTRATSRPASHVLLTQLLLALGLSLPLVASAADPAITPTITNWGPLPVPDQQLLGAAFQPGATSFTFLDQYNFSVPASSVFADATALDFGASGVSDLQLELLSGSQVIEPWSASQTETLGPGETVWFTSFSPQALSAGSYALEVTGLVSAAGGTYSGELVTAEPTATPLPATWILFLTALATLYWFARRGKLG